MLAVSLVWLALGALIGLLTLAARLAPSGAASRDWRTLWRQPRLTPLLGALVALAGGWLATLLLDRIFATCAAVWLSVAVVVGVGLLTRRQAGANAQR